MLRTFEHVETLKLPLDKVIADKLQPRKSFNTASDDELIQSFQNTGQLVPIIVFQDGEQWQIVDGERRWRSANALEWQTIEAKILPSRPSESQLLVIQLTTNCQRSDLHPLDRLEAFKQLMRLGNWKATELATQLAISKPTVSRILSLDRFTDDEKHLLRNGAITASEAYTLARLSDQERHDKLATLTMSQPKAVATNVIEANRNDPTLTLELGSNTIRVKGRLCESFDAMLEAFKELMKECKRAKRDGIDPKTWARVLADKSQTLKQERAHVPSIS